MAKNENSLFGGLLIGAAIGAVVGLLTAPASGRETRKKLGDESKKLADRFGQSVNETASRLQKKYEQEEDESDD